MSVRKINNSWVVDISFDHLRYRKKSPENTRTGAQAYETVLRQKLARGESIDETKQQKIPSFEDFAVEWFANYVIPNNKHQEQRMKHYHLKAALNPFFGRIPIDKITTRQVEQFKAQMLESGLSHKTINNKLAVLRKCVMTGYEWHKITSMPPKFALLKCQPASIEGLSADECELLLKNSEGVIYEMLLTALRTGMRQGEIRGLQWASIDWESRMITVRHSLNDRLNKLESPKSNRERHIPIDVDILELLAKRKKATGYVFTDPDNNNRPFDSQRLIRRLNEVIEKAELKHFGWHALRHTFGTRLAMKGAPLNIVQRLLGHSDIRTTMRYAHVAPSELRAAIDLLNPKTAINANLGQYSGSEWFAAHDTRTV